MVACRSRGAAPTRCQATASAIAALGPLADVAVDGGRQTLPSLTPNLCLSRLIQESSGFWYRFQLLSLNATRQHRDQPTLHIGIGINSGEAIVGNIGSEKRMEYTVIGDMVNVAQRLQALARGGEILIGASTLPHVQP